MENPGPHDRRRARSDGILRGGPHFLASSTHPAAPSTEDVYEHFSPSVVKIEVSERSSGASRSLGSAFFVRSDGILATNYHVIERLIHEPERYEATWHPEDGDPGRVEVLALDIVHDLALVRAVDSPESVAPLSFLSGPPRRGRQLYSLGDPLDLGRSIVEGTYNGGAREARPPPRDRRACVPM